MNSQTKEQITKLLVVAGYEKELNDIFFIEDINLEELEQFNLDDELLEFDYEPIEFDELY